MKEEENKEANNWLERYKMSKKQRGGYIVKQGETLGSIAKKLGTTWQELQRKNKLIDPNKIYIGQSLDTGQTTPLTLDEILYKGKSVNKDNNYAPIEQDLVQNSQETEKAAAYKNIKANEKVYLQDFNFTKEDLEYLNTSDKYKCTNNPNCVTRAFGSYDKLIGGREYGSIPTSEELKKSWKVQSLTKAQYDKLSPKAKKAINKISYFNPKVNDFSADSWDIHGLAIESGGKNIFTDPTYEKKIGVGNLGFQGSKWGELTDRQKKDLYKKMTIGTIIGLGGLRTKESVGLNSKYGLANNRHTAIVVGFTEDGVPVINDFGGYKRLDNIDYTTASKTGKPITNITIPKETIDKTFEGLKKIGIFDTKEGNKKANINISLLKPGREMLTFKSSLAQNKNQLMADLNISSNDYDRYSKMLLALSMNEVKGGKSIAHKIQTPLGLGKTIGLTQLDINNILSKPELANIARKYSILKKEDLKDPTKAAIASIIYAKDLAKTSSIYYNKGKKSGERTFKYNPRSKAFNEKGFFIEETNKYIPTNIINKVTNITSAPLNFLTSKLGLPTSSNISAYIGNKFGLGTIGNKSIAEIQRELDINAPGIYMVKKDKDNNITIVKKTKGNVELTPEEKFFYAWQAPGVLLSGDARNKSAYVNKAMKYYNLINARNK